MKGLTIIMCLVALFSCSKSDILSDPISEANSKDAVDSRSLKLLYLADGVEIKTRQELIAIMDKELTTTIYSGNSALAHNFGDRAKYGVAVITTK